MAKNEIKRIEFKHESNEIVFKLKKKMPDSAYSSEEIMEILKEY